MSKKEIVIGIDLGTTYSMASYVSERGVELIENEEFSTKMPSTVAISGDKIYVGVAATAFRETDPENFFYSFKRFMGRGVNDFSTEEGTFPFPIEKGKQNNLLLGKGENRKTPEQLSAYLLAKIKTLSEKILQLPIHRAVITVPAYFDDIQRQAVKDAAKIAGLEALRIINEPTAAALAYGLESATKGKILVYDLGGGTFDVSILELKEKIFKVLATKGDTKLGGDDFDKFIEQKIVSDLFGGKSPDSLRLQSLKNISEQLKIKLSSALETSTKIDFPELGIFEKFTFTRAEFDAMIEQKIDKTVELTEKAIADSKIPNEEIQEIVLVGGSSRIPLVREKLRNRFDAPLNLRIDPDKVVSFGAGIQGFHLTSSKKKILLLDVIPLSLGIETIGGVFSKLIVKNSSIPAQAEETFSTSKDNQTSVRINIYQGEREFVKDCRLLGEFRLRGIPPMPAGLPRMEVKFLIDENGMLSVSAKELRSGIETRIEIIPEHGLTPAQVEKMIEESIEYAPEDFAERHLVEFKTKAESILDGLEKIAEQTKQICSPKKLKQIKEQKTVLSHLIAEGKDPQELKKEIDRMGELTRDLADQIMSLAAKENLIS